MAEEFGVIGLGKMGGGLAHQALEKGVRVVGLARHGAPKELVDAGLVEVREAAELAKLLHAPRIVLLYIPAGEAVDKLIDKLTGVLKPGDVIVDGGNSYWGDSIRRARRLKEKQLRF